MPILIIIIFTIIILFLINYKAITETKMLSSDALLDIVTEKLPSNDVICDEMLKMLGGSCKVELDDKTRKSAYIYFLDKIILSNTEKNRKNYSRVLVIAHECVHAVQDKTMHAINFILANTCNVFDIVLIALIVMRRCSLEWITISLLISFFSFYYRIILEADATYRSIIYSRKYLSKYNMENVADRYEEIIPKTISGMYFSYIAPVLIRHIVVLLLFLLF